ncbi:MAG: ABC transporter substrate-binding protein [Phaeospirillum sp.]|nr:ABC transporter substrate-binding protein [Phaeospirillum sp.]
MVTRRIVVGKVLACLVLFGLALWGRPASALDAATAEGVVKSAIADSISAFVGGPFTQDEVRAKITMMVEKYADVPYESEQLLGRHWRKASPAQQKAFTDLLVPFFVATYGGMIDGAKSAPKIEFVGTEARGEAILVHTNVKPQGEEPVPIDWLILISPAGKLVVGDLIAEDIGLVTTMKADFTSVIRSGGGDIEALFTAMRKKIQGAESAGKGKPAGG